MEKVSLKRHIRIHHAVAINLGLMIGTGIYISPKGLLVGAGSAGVSLILWVLCGGIALCGALTFAELGCMFPGDGEKYLYLEKMFGPFPSFMYIWTYLLMIRPGSNAVKCIVFANYILQPLFPECDTPESALMLLEVTMALFLTIINCRDIKWAARGQSIFTTLSSASLVLIAITGLYYIGKGDIGDLENAFEGKTPTAADISQGLYAGIFACWGWNAVNFMIEEMKTPEKTLPASLIISIALVTGLYILVNLAYIVVVGVDGILTSNAIAVTFASKAFGPFAWVISIFIAMSCVSSYNSGMLVASRLAFAGARNNHLPQSLSMLNIRSFSPVVGVILQGFLVVTYCLAADIDSLLKNLVFGNQCFELLCAIGFLYLRWKRPDLHRPLKIPIVIAVIYTLFLLYLVTMPIIFYPEGAIIGSVIIVCTGVPYYILFVVWKKPSVKLKTWNTKFTSVVQKLLICIPEEVTTTALEQK